MAARPRSSEDELIARYFAPLAGPGAFGLRDDAAVLRPAAGHELVVKVDAIAAGVHFFADDPPAAIARKGLAVNISDLAAKGAEPSGFLLALALADDWTDAWLAAFAAGLAEAADAFRCPLLGGDTVRANGAMWLSVTAFGQVPAGAMVQRHGARPGDRLCVTGTIGDAALGLALRRTPAPAWAAELPQESRDHLRQRYLLPQPRLGLIPVLRAHAHAAMDISDGLVGDLAKMMRVSGTSAVVEVGAVPLSAPARSAIAHDPDLRLQALTSGDDYEILFSVAPERIHQVVAEAAAAAITVTPIGTVTEGSRPPVLRDGNVEFAYDRGSYSHF